MHILVHADSTTLGAAAGLEAARLIADAIRERGHARIVVATGASQFATLATLVAQPGIDWSVVECFHLDEYVGLDERHPASFRRYLKERFVAKVPTLRAFHGVAGDAPDLQAECARLGRLIAAAPIDVLLLGIGENAHLAFNDPPADLTTKEPYLVVQLDEACRRQQLGEGWFPDLDAVPRRAISMSISQILSARILVASVPDQRKARAVQASLEQPESPLVPGAAGSCTLHLDHASASLLQAATLTAAQRR